MTASPRISKAASLETVDETASIDKRDGAVKGPRYAWVTKTALQKGGLPKIRIECRPSSQVLVRDADSRSGMWYVLGIEAFEDLGEAIADARHRRDIKIQFLQGQINRLRRLDFKEPNT
jgi:hypothetical protein